MAQNGMFMLFFHVKLYYVQLCFGIYADTLFYTVVIPLLCYQPSDISLSILVTTCRTARRAGKSQSRLESDVYKLRASGCIVDMARHVRFQASSSKTLWLAPLTKLISRYEDFGLSRPKVSNSQRDISCHTTAQLGLACKKGALSICLHHKSPRGIGLVRSITRGDLIVIHRLAKQSTRSLITSSHTLTVRSIKIYY